MKITTLVENYSKCNLKPRHGLSFYIETKKHKILFDLGSDNTIFKNAKLKNIDLSKVDTVIISHSHLDHTGALSRFLKINLKANVYVQRKAFELYYSKFLFFKINIGMDKSFQNHHQIILLDGDYKIDEELSVFIVKERDKCYSLANNTLYNDLEKDTFLHEQNLIISENKTALIMGCGHTGILNIMDRAKEYNPNICIGGYHLINPITKKNVPNSLLDEIARELKAYNKTTFYTCHCTGLKNFQYLSKKSPNLFYLSCGEIIET